MPLRALAMSTACSSMPAIVSMPSTVAQLSGGAQNAGHGPAGLGRQAAHQGVELAHGAVDAAADFDRLFHRRHQVLGGFEGAVDVAGLGLRHERVDLGADDGLQALGGDVLKLAENMKLTIISSFLSFLAFSGSSSAADIPLKVAIAARAGAARRCRPRRAAGGRDEHRAVDVDVFDLDVHAGTSANRSVASFMPRSGQRNDAFNEHFTERKQRRQSASARQIQRPPAQGRSSAGPRCGASWPHGNLGPVGVVTHQAAIDQRVSPTRTT